MTLQASGQIAVSDISVEIGQAATYSTDLNFLNNLITAGQAAGAGTGGTGVSVSSQRPGSPNLNSFYGLSYFQASIYGNCNNGNCTSNCNCGNIQCNNCTTSTINCSNCDSQSWLQTGTNCACTYNCSTNLTSYNCNCACNCSKIVCGKLYDLGMMSHNVWAADQAYGRLLRTTDKNIYRGYIRWARPVTQWMDGRGYDFMLWVNKEERKQSQAKMMIALTHKVGKPWSEHMAYLMGAIKNDNEQGRILMKIGRFFCKGINYIPKVSNKYKKSKWLMPYALLSAYTIWFLLEFSYYTSLTYLKSKKLFDELTNKEAVKEH